MNQKELDKQIRYLRNEFSEKFDQLQKDQKLIWKAILKMAENVDTQKEVIAEALKLTNDVQKGSVDLFREMMDEIESLKHNKIPKKYYFRLRNQKGRDIVLATIIDKGKHLFDNTITLPTTIKEINSNIETSIAKKKFGENSSIQIKEYLLDKNEKKLNKDGSFLILTEKEIQLLELFEKNSKPISKKKILSLVWHYACLLYTSPSPRDRQKSRMPSSA